VRELVAAAVEGRFRHLGDMLRADPTIARRSVLAATVLGDATAVREAIAVDPGAATAIDDDRGWPPLLYACYSRWAEVSEGNAGAIAEVVGVLLDGGANPNTNDGGRQRFRSALKGSVERNNPDATRMLLDAGADPDLGQPIAEAAAHRDNECLQLLLARDARVAGTWAIGAAVYNDNPGATALLLGALQASGGRAADAATEALPEAAANASLPVVAALLDAGADPGAADDDGVTALRLALRAGRDDTAARLRARGSIDDGTDVDRFIGACLNAARGTAGQLLAADPGLRDRLTDEDRAVIVDAAGSRPAEAIALMLSLGFSPHARRYGEEPLHAAAYRGDPAVVAFLLHAGADVDACDARFDSTPLAFATVGSGEQAGKPGDWIETVRLLIEAGAARHGVWITGKPPSEEVAELLLRYDIAPDDSDEQQSADQNDEPGSIGTGLMADIAQHLEAAYRDLDLDLLGSLLHPDVQWTGVCRSSADVLDWYRALLADGTTATVHSVEVDRDAVILALSVARPAQGARPAPPQRTWQVFTVGDAQIIDIRGYPDRRSALTRTHAHR
jgi:ankyrin repeat protein